MKFQTAKWWNVFILIIHKDSVKQRWTFILCLAAMQTRINNIPNHITWCLVHGDCLIPDQINIKMYHALFPLLPLEVVVRFSTGHGGDTGEVLINLVVFLSLDVHCCPNKSYTPCHNSVPNRSPLFIYQFLLWKGDRYFSTCTANNCKSKN